MYVTFLGYVVEKRPKGSDNWVKALDYPCTDPNYTVTGLPEGSEWEFRVMAVNAAGNSEPSLATAPIKIKEKVGKSEWVMWYQISPKQVLVNHFFYKD